MDLENFNPSYTKYLGTYHDETKTYTFNGGYYIPAAGGGFGLVSETFVIGAEAPAAARSIPAKELGVKLNSSIKANSRWTPKKVEKNLRKNARAAIPAAPVPF